MAYPQDILSFCQKADSTMTDSSRVEHILEEIADDAFNLLRFTNCATAADVVIKYCRFEQAKSCSITCKCKCSANVSKSEFESYISALNSSLCASNMYHLATKYSRPAE